MAWIEPLAPRDTNTGSSRAHDTTRRDTTQRAIPWATVFGFQKTNAEGTHKQEGDGTQEKRIRSLGLIVSSN